MVHGTCARRAGSEKGNYLMFFGKTTRPVFILGCQRSGTTICQNVFLKSADCDVYREGNKKAMTDEWRLRDTATIRRLIRKSRKRVALFKPLNDAQWARRFLDGHEHARIVWIYRDPGDTANSAIAKWDSVQADIINTVGKALAQAGDAAGAARLLADRPGYAMYAEGIPAGAVERVIGWSREGLDAPSGAGALWWLRNQFYQSLDLNRDARVLLVKYEPFVTEPSAAVRRICAHMGIGFDDRLVADVHSGSVGRRPPPSMSASVAAACEELFASLDADWNGSLESGGGEAVAR
jgi:hypothetical protein